MISLAVLKKKSKVATEAQLKEHREKCTKFFEVKKQLNALKAQETKLKAELDAFVDAYTKKDTKGNRFFHSVDYSGKPIILERMAKKSFALNKENARLFFKQRGLLSLIFKTRTITEEYIDEAAINEMHQCGDLTKEDIATFTDITETYATTFVKQKAEKEEE